MKQTTFLLMLTFFTLILTGCQEKTVSKKSSDSNNSSANCSGQAYWTTPGCIGYCQNSPGSYGCGSTTSGTTGSTTGGTTGTTTGGTTGGTTGTGVCASNPSLPYCSPSYCSVYPKPYGCLSNGTNCYLNQTAYGCGGSSVSVNPNWGIHYPPNNVPPTGYCSDPVDPPGLTGALATRKGTITLAGETSISINYSPFGPNARNGTSAGALLNTSPMLMSVAQAKMFFITDSVLKLRIKVKPQPEASQSNTMCAGRNMPGTKIPGYTKLKYNVKVYSVSSANAVSYMATLGPFTTAINACSDAIDLSNYQEQSPTGIVITVEQVQSNQECSGSFWTANGFSQCNSFGNVRSFDCWSMDFEVAADGTKTFD
jgi:hypothetical protein